MRPVMVRREAQRRPEPVTRGERESLLGQKGTVVWLTGLPGAGKSTLAVGAERELHDRGVLVRRLDGDELRRGLNAGLSFSMEDRRENVRRIAEAARLHLDAGLVCLVAVIAPTRDIRAVARGIVGADDYREVYVDCPLAVCEARDPRGLYRRARAGGLNGLTGVDSVYEPPDEPALEIHTDLLDVAASVALLTDAVAAWAERP
jgi:adenylylsulfate kinase